MERELDNARKYAIERFAAGTGRRSGDALEAGINAGAGESRRGAARRARRRPCEQLQRAFDKAGIKVIDPVGQPFDPAWHEAMVAQESARSSRPTRCCR